MAWLKDLFGAGATPRMMKVQWHELELPAVRIYPYSNTQVLDLRAVDAKLAIDAGIRVAIEMIRTLPEPLSRIAVFSPEGTRALLDLDTESLKTLSKALRAHLKRNLSANKDVLVVLDLDGAVAMIKGQSGTGEAGIVVPPELRDRAQQVLAPLELLTIPDRGLGSGDILDKLGPPTRDKGYTIELPMFAPDLVHAYDVPGVAMRWNGKLLVDLRRVATGTEYSFGVSFIAAKLAIERLTPFSKRTWIIAPWQLGTNPAEALRIATAPAREAIALGKPELDRVVFDGDPSQALVDWVEALGLHVSTKKFALTPNRSLTYPQLAQNLMLDYAMRGR